MANGRIPDAPRPLCFIFKIGDSDSILLKKNEAGITF